MASATSISATEPARGTFPRKTRVRATRVGSGRLGGALLLGNTIALILLVFGVLGLGAYRDQVIDARAETLETRAHLARAALTGEGFGGCGQVSCLRQPRRAEALLGSVAQGFDGNLFVYGRGASDPVAVLRKPVFEDEGPAAVPIPGTLPRSSLPSDLERAMAGAIDAVLFDLPMRSRLAGRSIDEEAAAISEGRADAGTTLRSAEDLITIAVSLPIIERGQVAGVVIAESAPFDPLDRTIRRALVPTLFLTFGLASLSALILTAAVTHPLRQLSAAAERVRSSVGRAGTVKLPDFDHRKDDIGRLSRSFRTMTEALVDRIESIDSFAADVSHELKNPLTSIKSAIETLPKCKTDHQRERLLDVIAMDVERMDRLISDISSASRLDAQLATETRKKLSASKLVGDVAKSYKAVTDAGGPRVNFWDDTDGDRIVYGSAGALGRVVRNLIDNAVSFSPPNGAVTVALEKCSHSGQQAVLVTVTDEGPGVPPENLESIFDRFYTSRPSGATFGSNSGLGLAIARQIVESHGGRLWAENVASDDDRTGARFNIELPLHKGQFG